MYNEAALRAHLEGLFAVGAIHGASDQDDVEGAITKLIAHPYKLFRFGLRTVEFRPDQQNRRAEEPKAPSDVVLPEELTEAMRNSMAYLPGLSDKSTQDLLWRALKVARRDTQSAPEPTYTATELAYIDAAREQFHKDGDLEADDYPVVSMSDEGGAYVQMWKWVPDSLIDLPEEDDNAQD